jgi:hypothetical protein
MAENALQIRTLMGVMAAALVIWLAVRVVNRKRGPWTFWMAFALLVTLATLALLATSNSSVLTLEE